MFQINYIWPHFKHSRKINILSGILLLLLIFSWIVKLNFLPGLHGDEAWFAIQAIEQKKHPLQTLMGMNTYTGLLQVILNYLNFEIFGINVFSLRIGGIIINTIGIIIICSTMLKLKLRFAHFFFLIFICQSPLLLTSPRIAWEVNTYTLFFVSIIFKCIVTITSYPNNKNTLPIITFLVINIIGSYNHIIFSSIPLSMVLGVAAWTVYTKEKKYLKLIIISFFSVLNSGLVALLFALYGNSLLFTELSMLLITCLLPVLQVHFVPKCEGYLTKISWTVPFIKYQIIIFLIISFGSFLFFHGLAFFDVLCGYKIFLQVYSFELPKILQIICAAFAMIVGAYLSFFLLSQIKNRKSSVIVFSLISYSGVLSLYTINNSFRYYLILYILIGIIIAVQIELNINKSILVASCLCFSFLLITYLNFKILYKKDNFIRVVDFKIGNKHKETSAHFLPKEPLITLLKKESTIKIVCLENERFFWVLPVKFYMYVNPWKELSPTKVVISYDYLNKNKGYSLYCEY